MLATEFSGVKENIQTSNDVLGDIKDNTTGLIDAQKAAITESLSGLTDENSTLSTSIKGILEAVQSIDGKMNGLGSGANNSNGETGGEKDPIPKPTTPTGGKKEPESPKDDDSFSKGAVLKNVTGKWYASSDGTGASGSTTPEKGADEWVIDKINDGSKYPYHIMSYKNGKFTGSGWVKKNQLAYKNGTKKVGYDQVAWTQENGLEYIIRPSDGAILHPVAQGDMVLNAEASKRLWEVSNNPMQFIKDNMSTSIPSTPTNNGNNNVENNIQMTITLPGVSNYQEFVTRLQSDSKFEKMIVDVTSSALTGNNSLSKYRHKF